MRAPLMTITALRLPGLRLPGPPSVAVLQRGIIAGAAWGLIMGLGLPLMTFLNCGVICLSDVVFTTAVSIVAGIATIGPLAAYRRPPVAPAIDLNPSQAVQGRCPTHSQYRSTQ
jgi:hypothetical protein